ncbi:hypothetical protein TNCT_697501 [Trichonephila clavata]|uniref:Uncharacterized protein n=1 Tax=Trichonephila clavata TaxID=2740835 RepID=A0A8X6KTE4_TRICU|nr:hypothetical protein TNCT_697501 [Trichonephila clavata]
MSSEMTQCHSNARTYPKWKRRVSVMDTLCCRGCTKYTIIPCRCTEIVHHFDNYKRWTRGNIRPCQRAFQWNLPVCWSSPIPMRRKVPSWATI